MSRQFQRAGGSLLKLCLVPLLLLLPNGPLAAASKTEVKPAHLRCEYLVDPLVIDEAHPRLSWLPAHDAASITERGQKLGHSKEVRFVRMEGDRAVLVVQSGIYQFHSKL